jgi:hypothetical protein
MDAARLSCARKVRGVYAVVLAPGNQMADRRPPVIIALRIAGALAFVAAALIAAAGFQGGELTPAVFLLAAAAAVIGLVLLGFASSLVLLHEIRRLLAQRTERYW